MTELLPGPAVSEPSVRDARWAFLRDVVVFEAKLALNNFHNFFQIPLTIGVALVDVCFKGSDGEGTRFYKLVEIGRTIDDSIDIYSVIAHRERSLNKDYTVDAVIALLEGVIVREYAKGGSAASVKQAVDRAIDGLQSRAGQHAGHAADAIRSAMDKLHERMRQAEDTDPPREA